MGSLSPRISDWAMQRWPTPQGVPHLHQTFLGYVFLTVIVAARTDKFNLSMWGMPIGEIFDLEGLSKACAEAGRYTFFFTSWPLNVLVPGCVD